MKYTKKLLALLLVLMLAFSLAMPAEAADETWVVCSTSGINLRNSASTSSNVLGVFGLGSVVVISRKTQAGGLTWGYVTSAMPGIGSWGKSSGGWLCLDYCMKGNPTNWVAQSNINLRSRADVNSTRLALLPKGTMIVVTETVKKGGNTWGRVAYAKSSNNEYWMRNGWVALDHCKPDVDIVALFKRLEGYWNATSAQRGWYLRFAYQNGKPSLYSGVWDSEGSGFGVLTSGQSTGENKATLIFVFPASSGQLVRSETTVTLQIDLASLESSGPIKMKLDRVIFGGNAEWNTFEYGGR